MLQGKCLQLAIRFILTQLCHLPEAVQQRFGLLVYLGRQAGGHLLSEHHLVVQSNPEVTWPPSRPPDPPHLHLSSHPPSQPHTGVFTPCPIWKITPKYAIIRRRVFRMEIRGQSAYSWSEKPRDIQLGSSAPTLLVLKTHNRNQSLPVVEISLRFSRRSKGFKMNLHLVQAPTLVDAMCKKVIVDTTQHQSPDWCHLGPNFLQESKTRTTTLSPTAAVMHPDNPFLFEFKLKE